MGWDGARCVGLKSGAQVGFGFGRAWASSVVGVSIEVELYYRQGRRSSVACGHYCCATFVFCSHVECAFAPLCFFAPFPLCADGLQARVLVGVP